MLVLYPNKIYVLEFDVLCSFITEIQGRGSVLLKSSAELYGKDRFRFSDFYIIFTRRLVG